VTSNSNGSPTTSVLVAIAGVLTLLAGLLVWMVKNQADERERAAARYDNMSSQSRELLSQIAQQAREGDLLIRKIDERMSEAAARQQEILAELRKR